MICSLGTTPNEPEDVRAISFLSNRSTVTYTPPESDGGSRVTSYRVDILEYDDYGSSTFRDYILFLVPYSQTQHPER